MRPLLLGYVVPILAILTGVLGGILSPPSEAVLWGVGILDALLAVWILVYAYGWGRAALYAAVAVALSFCAEYALIAAGLLTHLTRPDFFGVAALNLVQDFFAVASPYLLACALLPAGGVISRSLAAGAIMLITTIVGGPFAVTLGYYIYNEPFQAWGDNIGLRDVPRVPWAEPIGMFILAVATTAIFAALTSSKTEIRALSPKWTALLYFHGQVLPGWAWAGYTGRWGLFALGTVLLTGLACLAFRASLVAAKDNKECAPAGQSVSKLECHRQPIRGGQ
jgi:hypothetical protein